jgi:hypothetical protein
MECPSHCSSRNAKLLVPGSPALPSPRHSNLQPTRPPFFATRTPRKRCLTTTAEETASHDIFGTPIFLRITKSVFFSLISYTAYCLQASSFSQSSGHERYQDRGSPYVDPLSPRLPASPSGHQNRTINPIAAQTTLYQELPIAFPFHATTPYASGRGGSHVDQVPYPAPRHTRSYRILQQMPFTNDYTQAYSTMSAHLPGYLLGHHNTEAYPGFPGQSQTQVRVGSYPTHANSGLFMALTGC